MTDGKRVTLWHARAAAAARAGTGTGTQRAKNATTYDPERHGPHRVVGPGFHARVFALVARVPKGKLTTYGDLAAALGHRGAARQVGYALGACAREVPWHRVVNARGCVSARADGAPSPRQIRLLRQEGAQVDAAGRVVDFARRRWSPAQGPA